MRLIDADAIRLKQHFFEEVDNVPKFYDWLDEQPTVDAVPVKVIEQFKWERDTAIQQLEEHGIPFCGKADVVAVVRCMNCKWFQDERDEFTGSDGFCPNVAHGVSENWFCADGERREEDDLPTSANHDGEGKE